MQEEVYISKEEENVGYHRLSSLNGGIVIHFMVRIEPFTQQSKNYQGGNFINLIFFVFGTCLEKFAIFLWRLQGADPRDVLPARNFLQ